MIHLDLCLSKCRWGILCGRNKFKKTVYLGGCTKQAYHGCCHAERIHEKMFEAMPPKEGGMSFECQRALFFFLIDWTDYQNPIPIKRAPREAV